MASVKDRQKRSRIAFAKFVQQLQRRKEPLVYLAKAGQRVKIGFASDVLARLRTLETGAGCPVQLLAVAPGGRQLEGQLHQQFEQFRNYKEWFQYNDEILQGFAAVPGAMVLLKGFLKQDAPLVA